MTDPKDLDQLRGQLAPFLAAGDARGRPTPGCLDDLVTAALADGTLESGARTSAVSHLASCSRCRASVASVVKALGDPAIRREIPASPRRTGRRVAWLAVPLAAAAALFFVVWLPRTSGDSSGPHRGSPASGTPVAIAPLGIVAEVQVLRWAPVFGADRYRITLFDGESHIVFAKEVGDVRVALPDSTVLVPGGTYVWMVEARTDWNRWTASAPVTFTLAPGGAP